MFELKLMRDTIEKLAEGISSDLNLNVTVVDKNLSRIYSTKNFYSPKHDAPEQSIFARIIETGEPVFNISKMDNTVCKVCPNYKNCSEIANMGYPIKDNNICIGIIGLVAFDDEQRKNMIEKKSEYFKILEKTAKIIENIIGKIEIENKLNLETAEVNEIINSINKGIMIINNDGRISHINATALSILEIDLSRVRVINKKINDVIKNINLIATENKEQIGEWEVNGKKYRVIYKINDVVIKNKKISTLIDFDEIRNIIKIAMKCTSDSTVTFSNIVGNSEKLKRVIEKAKIAASSQYNIYLKGESGTGKELFARSIHNGSSRKNEPFIAINCSSIPENLLESELFGYEKGAFTGANSQGKIGKFELANNGTLLLDEIGDLPLHLQPKLLRVIQDMEIVRIGGNNPIKINVRIISATHDDLAELVSKRRFREDLFYRLNVIPLNIPPLRERDLDVLILSEYILDKIYQKYNIKRELSKEVEEAFLDYEWPGNVRELENVLEYSSTFSSHEKIMIKDLPEYFNCSKKYANNEFDYSGYSLKEIKNKVEKNVIENYIRLYGDTTEAKKIIAEKLEIGLATLYRKCQELDIKPQ